MSYLVQREKNRIKLLINHHPTLLVDSPLGTGQVRVVEALLEHHLPNLDDEAERKSVLRGNHPDLIVYDGRELKIEDARALRDESTRSPARWTRKYAVITYLERPHYTVMPLLLKLIEEPPPRFSAVLITSHTSSIPPTILSRAFKIRLNNSSREETERILTDKGIEEAAWRAQVCGGDPDVGLSLDVSLTRQFQKLWSAIISGTQPPDDYPKTWGEPLFEASEETQIACWQILGQLVLPFLDKHIVYGQIGQQALKAKSLVRKGRMTLPLHFQINDYLFALGRVRWRYA